MESRHFEDKRILSVITSHLTELSNTKNQALQCSGRLDKHVKTSAVFSPLQQTAVFIRIADLFSLISST
jgi:hypothetical protein